MNGGDAMRKDKLRGLTATGVAPATVPVGSPDLAVTVTGSGFSVDTVASLAGTDLVTEVLDPTRLRVTLRPQDVAGPGRLEVVVRNRSEHNGPSGTVTIDVLP